MQKTRTVPQKLRALRVFVVKQLVFCWPANQRPAFALAAGWRAAKTSAQRAHLWGILCPMFSPVIVFKRVVRGVSIVVGVVAVSVMLAAATLWLRRIHIATRAVHAVLARQGMDDVSFRLTKLSPWRLALRDVHWGEGPVPLLAIDQIDLHYSPDDLPRRHVERIHVQGVRTTLLVQDGAWVSPLAERLKPLLPTSDRSNRARPASDAPPFSFWMTTLHDVRIAVATPSDPAEPLACLAFSGGGVGEADGRYRFWGQVQGEGSSTGMLSQVRLVGSADLAKGAVTLTSELAFPDLAGGLAVARQLAPDALSHCAVEPRRVPV